MMSLLFIDYFPAKTYSSVKFISYSRNSVIIGVFPVVIMIVHKGVSK